MSDFRCELHNATINSARRNSKSCKRAECHYKVSAVPCTTEPEEPVFTSEPCSNSVLTGVSRFTWDTMQGCCREDGRVSHHDSASIWYFDGAGPIEPAIANCSAACAANADCTAYEVSRIQDRGVIKCENHAEPINSASRDSKSCKKAVCSAKTGCTTTLQITSFSIPCLSTSCLGVDTPQNENAACAQAVEAVGTSSACSMLCADVDPCEEEESGLDRARSRRQQGSVLTSVASELTIIVAAPANMASEADQVAPVTDFTIPLVVTDPATNETTTVIAETEEPEVYNVLPNNQNASTDFFEDLAEQLEQAPACGDDVCCDTPLCTDTFGSDSKCCSDVEFCRTDVSCVAPPFAVVRPFFAGDASDLADSFVRWGEFPPCKLNQAGRPHSPHLPVPLTLYFSGNVDMNGVAESFDTILNSTQEWRKCFTYVTLIGANMTANEDVYHNDQSNPNWNLGPNLQFYKLLQRIKSIAGGTVDKALSTTFFYMEGDTIPTAVHWLDALATEITTGPEFSVLGGSYSGHNWNSFFSDDIPDSLRYHINGNAVYNTGSALVARALEIYENASATFATTFHSSFDVHLCELLLDVDGTSASSLASKGYRANALFANFAQTLVLPQDVPKGAVITHGGVYVHNWPSSGCTRFANLSDWYPGEEAAGNVSTEPVSLSLVVTDFGDAAELGRLVGSLATRSQELASAFPQCAVWDNLPFSEYVVVTSNQTAVLDPALATYIDSSAIKLSSRNWAIGPTPSARWDLCDAEVESDWFMLANTFFTAPLDFNVPVEKTADGGIKPLAPYLEHDSPFCDRECRNAIKESRAHGNPNFDRHYGQEFAVFNTAVRNEYCTSLANLTSAEPSIDGYFSFMSSQGGAAATNQETAQNCEDDDAFWCDGASGACGDDDEFGDYVRERCASLCQTCGDSAVAIDDFTLEPVHEKRPTFDWWERKVANGSSNGYFDNYKTYRREKLFVVTSFDSILTARCEDLKYVDGSSESDLYAKCPCVFPFYYKGEFHSSCTDETNAVIGNSSAPWCPTAVQNSLEFVDGSEDVRNCVANDYPIRLRRNLPELKPELNFERFRRNENCSAGLESPRKWHLSKLNQSCDDVCEDGGKFCHEDSFRAALAEGDADAKNKTDALFFKTSTSTTGQIFGDFDPITCVEDQTSLKNLDRGIYFYEDREGEINCRGMSTTTASDIITTCEASSTYSQRLCLCCA